MHASSSSWGLDLSPGAVSRRSSRGSLWGRQTNVWLLHFNAISQTAATARALQCRLVSVSCSPLFLTSTSSRNKSPIRQTSSRWAANTVEEVMCMYAKFGSVFAKSQFIVSVRYLIYVEICIDSLGSLSMGCFRGLSLMETWAQSNQPGKQRLDEGYRYLHSKRNAFVIR